MAAPSGISAQFGFASETSWGAAVTVTKFNEFNSEQFRNNLPRFQSKGLGSGRRTQHRYAAGVSDIKGQVTMELPNANLATLLKHMFGTVATTGAGPYTHTVTPGPLTGLSMTTQFGRPDITGTVQPFTYSGCKVADWELSADVNDYAHLMLNLTGKAETTGTSLAVASYPANLNPLTYVQSSLTIAGSSVAVRKFSMKGNNNLKSDRSGPGSGLIREQLENGIRDYTGTIEADFESLTNYNRFVNTAESSLVLTFANGSDTLTVTANVRYDGETPNVAGPELLTQNLPFAVTSTTSDAAAITVTWVTSNDTAA